jgi:hypothetical protein
MSTDWLKRLLEVVEFTGRREFMGAWLDLLRMGRTLLDNRNRSRCRTQ